jgi:hypothetical protein
LGLLSSETGANLQNNGNFVTIKIYAIRGTTVRGAEVRVIVAFDEESMLIITVIKVE